MNLQHSSLHVGHDRFWVGIPHLRQHNTLVILNGIGAFELPGNGVGTHGRFPICFQPIREIPFAIGHPRAHTTGFVSVGTVGHVIEIGRVKIKTGCIGYDQLVLQRFAIEEFLQQPPDVPAPLAVARKDDRATVVPVVEVVLERSFYIFVGQLQRLPTGAVLPGKNADVCLSISRCIQSAADVKGTCLQPHGILRIQCVDFAVVHVSVPVLSPKELGGMNKKNIHVQAVHCPLSFRKVFGNSIGFVLTIRQ